MSVARVAIASVLAVILSLFVAPAAPAAAPTKHPPVVRPTDVSSHLGVDAAVQAEVDRRWLGAIFAAKLEEAKAAEAADAERAAAARRAQTVSTPRRTGGVNWDGIARCETGSNWQHVGYGDDGSRYEGGLGFYHGAWTDFGGTEFAPNANLATREQQIIVAERIYARHGLSGWGCRAYG